MTVKTKVHLIKKLDEPKVFLVSMIENKHVPWDFSVRMLKEVFHRSDEDAKIIADEIQASGEGICGAYIYEIAETKAAIVERQANKENFSLQCLLEEI